MKIKVNEMSINKTKDLLKTTMKDNDFCFDSSCLQDGQLKKG